MILILVSLLTFLRDGLRTRVALQAEIIALRHQLAVLQRRNKEQRLRLSPADRLLWIWLSRVWLEWRSALRIFKPETVIAWHRKAFRLYWSWKSRPRKGRPPVATEVRELIRRISAANPGWGAPRIHGELGKLGITVSETTVAKYMVRQPTRPSQTWRTFLTNHIWKLVAVDFFVVPTATFRLLFVFVILAHDRRGPVHFAVTSHATAEWTPSNSCRLFPGIRLRVFCCVIATAFTARLSRYRSMARDRGSALCAALTLPERLRRTADRVNTARMFGSRHCLRRVWSPANFALVLPVLRSLQNPSVLAKDTPIPRPIQPPELGKVIEVPEVSGLHQRYERRAA